MQRKVDFDAVMIESMRYCPHALIAIVILYALFYAAIVASGSTFGQICAKKYVKYTPEWTECVNRICKGGPE